MVKGYRDYQRSQMIAAVEVNQNLDFITKGLSAMTLFNPEMEGAAIAQAAYLNDVPFVVLRAISDKADDSASMDYPTFEAQAAEHCVKLVEHFLELI